MNRFTPLWASVLFHAIVIGIFIWIGGEPKIEKPIELSAFLERTAEPSKSKPEQATHKPQPQQKTPPPPEQTSNQASTHKPTDTQATSMSPQASSLSGEALASEDEVANLPILLKEVRVPYPPSAKAHGVQGAVIFELVIGSNGQVSSAKAIPPYPPELLDAALAAVKQFQFRPAILNHKPVAIQIRYTYRFVLQ